MERLNRTIRIRLNGFRRAGNTVLQSIESLPVLEGSHVVFISNLVVVFLNTKQSRYHGGHSPHFMMYGIEVNTKPQLVALFDGGSEEDKEEEERDEDSTNLAQEREKGIQHVRKVQVKNAHNMIARSRNQERSVITHWASQFQCNTPVWVHPPRGWAEQERKKLHTRHAIYRIPGIVMELKTANKHGKQDGPVIAAGL